MCIVYVLYIRNYREIVQSLFLKYLMEVLEPEDPHQFENLNSNHEYHSWILICPPGNKRKGADIAWSLHIPKRAGTNATCMAFEASSSHVGRVSVSLPRFCQLCSWDPAQHYLQGGTVGSIHTDNTHPFWTGCQAWHSSCFVECALGH